MPGKDVSALVRPGMGLSVIEPSHLDTDPWNGRLLVWESPQPAETYALGIDPAMGVARDRSVCQVIRIGTLYRPDEQVAEFACDFLDPVFFADIVNTIGRFYGTQEMEAFATVEINADCGDTLANDLRMRLDYSNQFIWKAYDRLNNMYTNKIGWYTTKTTRPKIIARGLHAMIQNDLIINSPYLIDEMADFKRDHTEAKAKARSGRHDDRVMALLIGYWGAHDEEWLNGDDLAEERRLRANATDEQLEMLEQVITAKPGRPDYQNQAMTYKQMCERSDEDFSDW